MFNAKILTATIPLLFFSCTDGLTGYDEKEKALLDRIKPGMTKNEVIEILGQPDNVGHSSVDSLDYEFIYFSKNKIGWSTEPTVSFHADTVESATYGDGENANSSAESSN